MLKRIGKANKIMEDLFTQKVVPLTFEPKEAYIKSFTKEVEQSLVKIGFSTYVEKDDLTKKWRIEVIDNLPYIVAVDENLVIHADQYDVRPAAQGAMVYKGDIVIDNIPLPVPTDVPAVTAHLKTKVDIYKHLPVNLFIDIMRKEAKELASRFITMSSNTLAVKTAAKPTSKKKTDKGVREPETPTDPAKTQAKKEQEEIARSVAEEIISSGDLERLDDLVKSKDVPISELLSKMLNVSPEELLKNVEGTAYAPIVKQIVEVVQNIRKKVPPEKLAEQGKQIKDILTGTSVQSTAEQLSTLLNYLQYSIVTTQMLRSATYGFIHTVEDNLFKYVTLLLERTKQVSPRDIAFDPDLQEQIVSFSKVAQLIAGREAGLLSQKGSYTSEDLEKLATTTKTAFSNIVKQLMKGKETFQKLADLPNIAVRLSISQPEGANVAKDLSSILTKLNILTKAQYDILSLVKVKTSKFQTQIGFGLTPAVEGAKPFATTRVMPSTTMGLNPQSGKAEFDTEKRSILDYSGILTDKVLNTIFMETGLKGPFEQLVGLLVAKVPVVQESSQIAQTIMSSKLAQGRKATQLKSLAQEVDNTVRNTVRNKLVFSNPAEHEEISNLLLNLKYTTEQQLNALGATDILPAVTGIFTKLISTFESAGGQIQQLASSIAAEGNEQALLTKLQQYLQEGRITWDKGVMYATLLGKMFDDFRTGFSGLKLEKSKRSPTGKGVSQELPSEVQELGTQGSFINIKTGEDTNFASLNDLANTYAQTIDELDAYLNKLMSAKQPAPQRAPAPSMEPAMAPAMAEFLHGILKLGADPQKPVPVEIEKEMKAVNALSKALGTIETAIGTALLYVQEPALREFVNSEFSKITGEGFSEKTTPMQVQDKVKRLMAAIARKALDLQGTQKILHSMNTDLLGEIEHKIQIQIERGIQGTEVGQLGGEKATPLPRILSIILGMDPGPIGAFIDLARNTIKQVSGKVVGITENPLVSEALQKAPGISEKLPSGKQGIPVEQMEASPRAGTSVLNLQDPTIFALYENMTKNKVAQLTGSKDKVQAFNTFVSSQLGEAFRGGGKKPMSLDLVNATIVKDFIKTIPTAERDTFWKSITPYAKTFVNYYITRPSLSEVKSGYTQEISGVLPTAQKYFEHLEEKDVGTAEAAKLRKMEQEQRLLGIQKSPQWAAIKGALDKIKFDIEDTQKRIDKARSTGRPENVKKLQHKMEALKKVYQEYSRLPWMQEFEKEYQQMNVETDPETGSTRIIPRIPKVPRKRSSLALQDLKRFGANDTQNFLQQLENLYTNLAEIEVAANQYVEQTQKILSPTQKENVPSIKEVQ